MEHSSPTITVGCSVNPELHLKLTELTGEKGLLQSTHVELGGSSANVATCLKNFGKNPNLIVLMEDKDTESIEKNLLSKALSELDIARTELKVLKKSPLAICLTGLKTDKHNIVFGNKGELKDRNMMVEHSPFGGETIHDAFLTAKETLKRVGGKWRIVTGVDKNTCTLADSLLGHEENDNRGYRSFGAHHSICTDEVLRMAIISYIFKKTDLFILNKNEFDSLEMHVEEIHSKGVSVIVVTDDKRGGTFSLCNESTNGQVYSGSYRAVRSPKSTTLYKIGAGDWFFGGLMNKLIEICHPHGSLLTLKLSELHQACRFGAWVASKKILMPGATNGPTIKDFQKTIKKE